MRRKTSCLLVLILLINVLSGLCFNNKMVYAADGVIGFEDEFPQELPFTYEATDIGIENKDAGVIANRLIVDDDNAYVLDVIDSSLIIVEQQLSEYYKREYIIGNKGLIKTLIIYDSDENWFVTYGGGGEAYSGVKAIKNFKGNDDIYSVYDPVTEKYDLIDATECMYYDYDLDDDDDDDGSIYEYDGYRSAIIKKDGKYGLIDLNTLNILYDCIYNSISYRYSGIFSGYNEETGEYFVLSVSGETDGSIGYKDIDYYSEDYGCDEDAEIVYARRENGCVDILNSSGLIISLDDIDNIYSKKFIKTEDGIKLFITADKQIYYSNSYDSGNEIYKEEYDEYHSYYIYKNQVINLNKVYNSQNVIFKNYEGKITIKYGDYENTHYDVYYGLHSQTGTGAYLKYNDCDIYEFVQKDYFIADDNLNKIIEIDGYNYIEYENGTRGEIDKIDNSGIYIDYIYNDGVKTYYLRNSAGDILYESANKMSEIYAGNYVFIDSNFINIGTGDALVGESEYNDYYRENGFLIFENEEKYAVFDEKNGNYSGFVFDEEPHVEVINNGKKYFYVLKDDSFDINSDEVGGDLYDDGFNYLMKIDNCPNVFTDDYMVYIDGRVLYKYDNDFNLIYMFRNKKDLNLHLHGKIFKDIYGEDDVLINNFFYFQKDDKTYVLDFKNDIVIGPFEDTSIVTNGVFLVKDNAKLSVIDNKCNILVYDYEDLDFYFGSFNKFYYSDRLMSGIENGYLVSRNSYHYNYNDLYFYNFNNVVFDEKYDLSNKKITSVKDFLNNKDNIISIKYKTQVQSIGWEKSYVSDGETSGTVGKAKRLEAIRIKLVDDNGNALDSSYGSVEYRTHVQKNGWEKSFVKDDALSGTVGKALRLEAIQIRLTGDIANKYDIYYRVQAEKLGWLGWAKNGEESGSAGYGYRLEAIQIKLVKKGEDAPASENNLKPFYDKNKIPVVAYKTQVQTFGWEKAYVKNGATSGTVGKAKRLEAIQIKISNNKGYSGGIKYKTHVQKLGWQNYVSNGLTSGTVGKGYRLEAIQIELTGDIANYFDVYYRVQAQKFGWMGWAKNGTSAGTSGFGYRLEAIQIQLVHKGTVAPGSTSNCFKKK
ncbi:Uncharacterized conserved protein YjdB, contains Ig-like domain [Lachnospiraceae bacterium RM5]|nr:Uncharacterized conserved protein YjdB, contains Ig-like domain [Lachnospiraceae bacterium RM5]